MIQRIASAVREADRAGRLVDVPALEGFSGDRLIGCLQRLAALDEERESCYLEIGVYRGLTLISVGCAAPTARVYGIDNFSHHDPRGENKSVVLSHAAAQALENVHLIDEDFEVGLASLDARLSGKKVGTYFVDGPHDYRSQLLCLELAKRHLAPGAAIVVDDSNYLHVRQANRDFLTVNPEFKLVFEAYTPCHPANMTAEQLRDARAGWWNGVNILAHDPEDCLARSFPPVDASRRFFFNDHLVHSSAAAASSDRATEIVAHLTRGRIDRAVMACAKLVRERATVARELKGAFANGNTFSEGLPGTRFNAALPAPTCDDAGSVRPA